MPSQTGLAFITPLRCAESHQQLKHVSTSVWRKSRLRENAPRKALTPSRSSSDRKNAAYDNPTYPFPPCFPSIPLSYMRSQLDSSRSSLSRDNTPKSSPCASANSPSKGSPGSALPESDLRRSSGILESRLAGLSASPQLTQPKRGSPG